MATSYAGTVDFTDSLVYGATTSGTASDTLSITSGTLTAGWNDHQMITADSMQSMIDEKIMQACIPKEHEDTSPINKMRNRLKGWI